MLVKTLWELQISTVLVFQAKVPSGALCDGHCIQMA